MSQIDPSLKTIPHLFAWRADVNPDAVAMWIKQDGQFQPVSWREFERDVLRAVDVLERSGVEAEARVIHVSENRYEWIVTDVAIQSLGAIHVPLHSSLTPVQQVEQILDSEPSCLVFSDTHAEAHIEPARRRIPVLPAFTYGATPRDTLTPWRQVLSAADPARGRAVREERLAGIDPTKTATILYTSGTTGEPKGVMLSQGNITGNALGAAQVFGDREGEVRLNFLPLSHIFARTCDIYIWIAQGAQLALAESRETIVDDCRAIKPHLMNGVPYFFERMMRTLQANGVADQPGVLKKALGGQMRLCCSGGAALPDPVYDYFESQALPLLQGYGLTESSPVISCNAPQACRRGSVGKPLDGVEVRIADDGEILTRGPHVMQGYWRKPAATAEVLQDGWLSTGDLGRLDEDGFVWITGRKKEILVTAGGKNVAPVLLESLLTQDPLILQAMVLGDGQKFLGALLVPDAQALRERWEDAGNAWNALADVLSQPQVRTWYEHAVQERLADLSHYEQVRRFCLLERAFTVEAGELTPKFSMRRAAIAERYSEQIQFMFS